MRSEEVGRFRTICVNCLFLLEFSSFVFEFRTLIFAVIYEFLIIVFVVTSSELNALTVSKVSTVDISKVGLST